MLRAAELKFWKSFIISMADFEKLDSNVKQKLFKQYCCNYYGSVLWQGKSKYYIKMCTSGCKVKGFMRRTQYSPPISSDRS